MSAQVYFKNIREQISEELRKSKVSIWLAVAWFTDPFLFNIICEKAKNGIKVRLILLDDDINNSNKSLDFESLELIGGEIVWVRNEQKGLMHNKFCTIDSLSCINGSYNWTIQAASSNQENITIHQDQMLTKAFEDEFDRLYNQFNQTVDIVTINKRLNVLKAILQDGDQDELDRQCRKLKDLLRYNIEMSYYAKPDLLSISNKIGKSDHSVLIPEIDKFISNNWTLIEDNCSDQLIPYRKGNKWGMCNTKKKIVIDFIYDEVLRFIDGIAKVQLRKKWGIINRNGEELTPCKYDFIYEFSEGLAKVEIAGEGGRCGFIDKKGKEVVGVIYEKAEHFREGLARVKLNGKYGFVNKIGEEVISCKYLDTNSQGFSDGLVSVRNKDHKTGYIDKTGIAIIDFLYDGASNFSEGLAIVGKNVGKNKERLCINKTGTEMFTCNNYLVVYPFHEGLALVGLKLNRFGYIDKTGNEVINCVYSNAEYFNEGIAKVRINNKMGIIDKAGNAIVPYKYDSIGIFSEGLALVKQDGLYGFIDRNSNEVIAIQYDRVTYFHEGLAGICIGDKYGFINKSGTIVIPCKYKEVESFNEGLARVKLNDKWGFIDKNGTEYWED